MERESTSNVEAGGGDTSAMSTGESRPADTSQHHASRQLADECEERWKLLQTLQEKIANNHKFMTAGTSNPQSTVYAAKERQLLAEAQVLRESENFTDIREPTVETEVALCELRGCVHELQETLSLVRTQQTEVEQGIRHDKRTLQQLKDVHKALKVKLDESSADRPLTSDTAVAAELNKKLRSLKGYQELLMRDMGKFVSKHFPPPTREELTAWNKKHKSGGAQPVGNGLSRCKSLQVILKELMNKCIESPHDPYITIDGSHWPPYIELLKRCGMVMCHSADDRQIRMTPFHH